MARINLLPWRAERRKQRQQEFFVLLGGALIATAGLLYLGHSHIEGLIDYQSERNRFLEAEVGQIDKQIKEIQDLESQKKRLIAKMEVIQQLQASRPETVHLLDELARTIPEGVRLIDMVQADRSLLMNGVAQSNARVSAYMRNLDSSPWLKEPQLNIIEARQETKENRHDRGSRFTLQVKQASGKTNSGKSAS